MKETPLSHSEKAFITQCIKSQQRIDGRSIEEFRKIRINFGSEWGSAHVSLGQTRVLAQVTCEIVQPKATRPNEGLLHINVEMGPMAAPCFEAGKTSEQSVLINRILERAFKDSRCVDLESLCISSEEKVWQLRVDLNVLNHEGNVIDCASVAALAALAHFKRPDVTTSGDEFKVHALHERDPIPIVLHHYPVCVTYAIFNSGEVAVADPTAIEERVSEASMVFGLNSYRELCGLHLGGITLTNSELLLQCANRGANRAIKVVEIIKKMLQEDEENRSKRKEVGFTECIRLQQMQLEPHEKLAIKIRRFRFEDSEQDSTAVEVKAEVVGLNEDTAVLIPAGEESEEEWVKTEYFDNEADEAMEEDNENHIVPDVEGLVDKVVVKKPKKTKKKRTSNPNSDSEEEETVVL